MKKVFTILFISLLFISFGSAWDTCSSNCIEGEAECGAYIDTDNSGACDHAEPVPTSGTSVGVSLSIPVVIDDSHDLITGQELKTKRVNEVAEIYGISSDNYANELSAKYNTKVYSDTSFQILHDNYNLEPSVAKEIALGLREEIEPIKEEIKTGKDYKFLPITLITVLLYLLTLRLARKKVISITNHRKVWNILLLLVFLISAILGIILVLRIEYGWSINLGFNILSWHVYSGIPFAAISVFHTLWHWPYVKKMFKFD